VLETPNSSDLVPDLMISQAKNASDKSSKICHFASPPVTSVVTRRSLRYAIRLAQLVYCLARSTPLNLREGVVSPFVPRLRVKNQNQKKNTAHTPRIRIVKNRNQLCSIHLFVASSTANTPADSALSFISTLPVRTLLSRPLRTLTATKTKVRSKASNTLTP